MSTEKIIIAIPSFAPGGLKSLVNTRFGRCEFFTITTITNNEISEVNIVPNTGSQAMGGAGPMAAQLIAGYGTKIVIGGNYGPNAANALQQGGIKTYGFPSSKSNVTVKDVIDLFLKNELVEINGSNVPSHHGMGGGGMGQGSGMGRGGGGGRGRG
ncbi:MAG: dinitrogenase iron-molybdenum cofactor biosynthesis protein [archaeon]|nr:dinitrogenase iron-molybdenum cofactor biosynthesis protein [archaeon]